MRERILAFLDQFPERLVEPALAIIERTLFLNREELGQNFSRFVLQSGNEVRTAGLTTDPGKSANLLSYYLNDAPGLLRQSSLVEALVAEAPICLFDDFLMSGKQARTAIQTLLGLPTDLNEHIAERLTAEDEARFRTAELHFRFAAAHSNGMESLRELLVEQQLNASLEALHQVDRITLGSAVTGTDYDELAGFLHEVGLSLLKSTKQCSDPEKWTDELCDERALGYSNMQLLVAAFYNVPTTTVTALWSPGFFRGVDWIPLVPRRVGVAAS